MTTQFNRGNEFETKLKEFNIFLGGRKSGNPLNPLEVVIHSFGFL